MVTHTWNHRVIVETGDGGTWFTVREVHYANRRIVGWTAKQAPGGGTAADLKRDLALMRKALAAPVLIERNGKLVAYNAAVSRTMRSKPWRGRPSEECEFQPGDIVRYRRPDAKIGIVLAQPLAPDEAVRLGCDTTDDVYLIGLLDEPDTPRGFHHDHVAEGRMTLVVRVAPEVRTALTKKWMKYRWAERQRKARRAAGKSVQE